MTQHGKFSINSLNGNFVNRKRFYLQDGSNLYRILPPFKTLAATGQIAKYWEIYWMKGTGRKQNGQAKKKPVPSLLVTKSNGTGVPRTIINPCPLHDKIKALTDMVTVAEKEGLDQDPIVLAKINGIKETLKDLNLDKAYYVNVMSPSGEIGSLPLRYTAFEHLKGRLKELEKEGIDAINVGAGMGIIFDFKKMLDDKGKTVYPVDIAKRTHKDPNTGKFIVEYQQLEIDESVLKRMETEAEDLTKLFKILSPEEVALIATLDPSMVDRVFSNPTVASEDGEEIYEDNLTTDAPVVAPKTVN